MAKTADRGPRTAPVLALLVVLLLVLAGGGLYKVRHHNSHKLSAGGGELGSATTVTSPTTSTTSAPSDTTTAVAGTTTSVPATTSTTGPPATTTTTVPLNAAGVTPAANGTYTYAVSGNETATGFGLRAFPARMTISVHGGSGIDARTQAQFDLSLSATHKERETVQWGPNGVSWSSESVDVVFGSMAVTMEDTYSPVMLQVPAQLVPGRAVSGASNDLKGSTLERVEDWKVRVVGTETLTIAGQAVPTVRVEVDRSSRSGAAVAAARTTTFWYSPPTRMWVKLAEHTHIQPMPGAGLAYDATFTASQVGFSPA